MGMIVVDNKDNVPAEDEYSKEEEQYPKVYYTDIGGEKVFARIYNQPTNDKQINPGDEREHTLVDLINYETNKFYYKSGNNYTLDANATPDYLKPYYQLGYSLTTDNVYKDGVTYYQKDGNKYVVYDGPHTLSPVDNHLYVIDKNAVWEPKNFSKGWELSRYYYKTMEGNKPKYTLDRYGTRGGQIDWDKQYYNLGQNVSDEEDGVPEEKFLYTSGHIYYFMPGTYYCATKKDASGKDRKPEDITKDMVISADESESPNEFDLDTYYYFASDNFTQGNPCLNPGQTQQEKEEDAKHLKNWNDNDIIYMTKWESNALMGKYFLTEFVPLNSVNEWKKASTGDMGFYPVFTCTLQEWVYPEDLDPDQRSPYTAIGGTSKEKSFYAPYRYYYLIDNVYYLDTNSNYRVGYNYYKLNNDLLLRIEAEFFKSGKYYYRNKGTTEWSTNTALVYNDDVEYSKEEKWYVTSRPNAESGIEVPFDVGAEWPLREYTEEDKRQGIILHTHKNVPTYIKLDGFAETLNTIHGLILQINKLLELDDTSTRDLSTVTGSINYLNDIIARFNELNQGDIVVIDDYGRFHGAGHDSIEEYKYQNIGYGEDENNQWRGDSTDDKQFIDIEVDSNVNNPQISVTHKSHSVTKETTTSNKNTGSGDGLNASTDDTLLLYTPIVDNKGHVVGKNTETVTLPYGFKTIKVSNSSATSDADSTIKEAGQIADNTQDTLTFSSTNKWIKFDNNSEDVIKIGHEVHNITTSAKTATDINGNGDTITIQDITFDAAGHATANQPHTYTLPYGYKKFTGNEGSTTANNTQDTAAILGDNWIKTIISNDTININHIGPVGSGTTTNIDATKTPALGGSFNIPTISYDSKGHIYQNDKYAITLPSLELGITSTTGSTEVLTGISYTKNGTKINATKEAPGTLKLGSYTTSSNLDNILPSSTISSALNTIQSRIDGIVGSDPNKTIRVISAEEVAKIVDGAPQSLDTLKEIATWISTHGSDAATMQANITSNTNRIGALEGLVGSTSVSSQISTALNSYVLKTTYEAKIAELEARIAELESKLPTE